MALSWSSNNDDIWTAMLMFLANLVTSETKNRNWVVHWITCDKILCKIWVWLDKDWAWNFDKSIVKNRCGWTELRKCCKVFCLLSVWSMISSTNYIVDVKFLDRLNYH